MCWEENEKYWEGDAKEWWDNLKKDIMYKHKDEKYKCVTQKRVSKSNSLHCTIHKKMSPKDGWRTIFQLYDSRLEWKNVPSNNPDSIDFLLGYEKSKEGLEFLGKKFAKEFRYFLPKIGLEPTLCTRTGDCHKEPKLSLNTRFNKTKFDNLIMFIEWIEECVDEGKVKPGPKIKGC